jgi:hypothetical protein
MLDVPGLAAISATPFLITLWLGLMLARMSLLVDSWRLEHRSSTLAPVPVVSSFQAGAAPPLAERRVASANGKALLGVSCS